MTYRQHHRDEVAAVIGPLARLRIAVFRDWPYLYDGNIDYEMRFLAGYAEGDGMVVTAHEGDRLVGASTATALRDQPAEVRDALAGCGHDVDDIYYCAESVLLPEYRGRGAGHVFFDAREANALHRDYAATAFCAVIRPDDHPARPDGYRPLDAFWCKRGYAPVPGAVARIGWRDVGEAEDTVKDLQFWLRPLART
ncbi:GNAT family N-acetyltransferase [Rhodobacterales bacterium HKCCE2091]|nr:GNAT family N-acetyltransferase [Rhodobacterales bacterium HKCCE2091]